MRPEPVQDLSGLPDHAFGHRNPLWWGNLGFVAIEGTVFVLAIASYFYLMSQADQWPPNLDPPSLRAAGIALALALASEVPNIWLKGRAERQDERATRLGLLVMLAIGLVMIGLRVWQFYELNCRWDTNAYGSIVWALLGLHTVHLVSDVGETAVITAMVWFMPARPRRFVDVSENQDYWHFVVWSLAVVSVVIYLVPRITGEGS